LVDRHFWVTAFMFVVQQLSKLSGTCADDSSQVNCHSPLLPPTSGLTEVYEYRRPGVNGLPGHTGGLSFCKGRHNGRARPSSSDPLGWSHSGAQ
jgi:hypothetical protein